MSIFASSDKPFYQRLTERVSLYTLVGTGTFLLDLALIFAFTTWIGVSQTYAIAVAFLLSVHVNYLLQRFWVYRQSPEKMERTYFYFIVVVSIATLIIPHLTFWFEKTLNLDMFTARIVVGTLLGLFGFGFNTFFNFKLV